MRFRRPRVEDVYAAPELATLAVLEAALRPVPAAARSRRRALRACADRTLPIARGLGHPGDPVFTSRES